MSFKNIMIAQSGGPSSAINASLAGVISAGMKSPHIQQIYGAANGIDGVLNNRIIDIQAQIRCEEDLALLKLTPAMALGSCRIKLPDYHQDSSLYETIENTLERYNIGCFFYLGGNDSMDTASKLASYFTMRGKDISVIGVPKTIDNDLACTDHTPGFGSAAKYIAGTVKSIARDCEVYNTPSVTLVEIMGRNAGWLTASSVLARLDGDAAPQLIYLCELPFNNDNFIRDVTVAVRSYRNVVVTVSEGLRYADGSYVGSDFKSGGQDVFGHQDLSGVGTYLKALVSARIGCKIRSVELNVPQRCASFSASLTDINESFAIGEEAVACALAGNTGKMMVFGRLSDHPYKVKISDVDVSLAANKVKPFPVEWISENSADIRPEGVSYLAPLIQGEPSVPYQNGIPVHFRFKREFVGKER